MEALYKKQIFITITLAIIAAVSIGGVFYFIQQMNVKEKRVREVKERVISYEQNKKIFIEESIELKELHDRTAKLEKYKVTLQQVPQLLSELEATASKYKVLFEITTVNTPQEVDVAPTLNIDFSVGGSYQNITDFLKDLEHQPYQIKYTSFTFLKRDRGPGASATLVPDWELTGSVDIVSF